MKLKWENFALDKIKGHKKRLEQEVKTKTLTYITAALGLVAGLAWNEAIKSMIEAWIPVNGSTVIAKTVYAFIITLVVVILTTYVVKGAKK